MQGLRGKTQPHCLLSNENLTNDPCVPPPHTHSILPQESQPMNTVLINKTICASVCVYPYAQSWSKTSSATQCPCSGSVHSGSIQVLHHVRSLQVIAHLPVVVPSSYTCATNKARKTTKCLTCEDRRHNIMTFTGGYCLSVSWQSHLRWRPACLSRVPPGQFSLPLPSASCRNPTQTDESKKITRSSNRSWIFSLEHQSSTL